MGGAPSARFFTWAQLRRANRIAERRGYNRQLADQFFIDFGRGTKFPIGAVATIDCDKSLYEELRWLPAEA